MDKEELNYSYFMWICQLVDDKVITAGLSYRSLLSALHDTEFTYSLLMDENRAMDGVDLRYRFGHEQGLHAAIIASYLDDRPSSVLETIVALALRCEEDIMADYDIGNRVSEWFWNMIFNLKLHDMDDYRYDERYVKKRLDIFLNRSYKRNGDGGLFTVKNCNVDLRTVEIWYQMAYYLNSTQT